MEVCSIDDPLFLKKANKFRKLLGILKLGRKGLSLDQMIIKMYFWQNSFGPFDSSLVLYWPTGKLLLAIMEN